MDLVVVTGLSGAGKSTVLKTFEDLGYFCADNLPMPLLPSFVDLLERRKDVKKAAVGIDARGAVFLESAQLALNGVAADGHRVQVVYLHAAEAVLVRRFSETRRRHPFPGHDLQEALSEEKDRLRDLRAAATYFWDTGNLTVHELRRTVRDRFGDIQDRLSIALMSFGFKHGLPADADMVLDVRFLQNPYFIPELKEQTGLDAPVRDFVLGQPDTKVFIEKAEALLEVCIKAFDREGKSRGHRPSVVPAGVTVRWRSWKTWPSGCLNLGRSRCATGM